MRTDTVMNVTQCKAGVRTELNDKTQSEQSSSESNLNGLPVELHENTGSRLSYSGVYHLNLVCPKNCQSIVNKTIKKAKDDLCYELPKMEEYNMNQEDIDELNEAIAQGKYRCFDHQFFSISNEGCVTGHIGRPKFRNFFSRFEFENFEPLSKVLHKSGLYISTGELENGLVFLKLPRLALEGSFMHYSTEFNKIVWRGDTNPTPRNGFSDLSFYSLCVGESFEQVLETFKKINCCKLLACLVEDMLQPPK